MINHHLDFGGVGPVMHLAPANGFPPESYRPLAVVLTDHFQVVGYRPRPLWPGSRPAEMRHWRDLATDLLNDLEERGGGPFIGIGHSLGGILTLYAALARPALFRCLVLLDPVLLPRHMLPLVWLSRRIGQEHRSPLAQGAARRRDRFSSVDEARQRYHRRGAFTDFVPDALEGYLEGGLRSEGDEAVTLAWPKSWEAHIFAKVPIDTWDAVGRLGLPLLLMRGTNSDLIIDRSWRQLKRHLPAAQLGEISGGHMFPLERPEETAQAIIRFVDSLS